MCFLFSSARQESPNCSSNASGRDGEVRVGGICTYRVFSEYAPEKDFFYSFVKEKHPYVT